MSAVGKDYLACDHARNQGTCSNKRGIKRALLEEVILGSLKSNLMQPHLVEEFIRAFHSEINRLEKESNVKKAHELAKHERVVRQLDGLYEAIADGLRTPGLKSKLEELEERKIEFETKMSATPDPQPTLHPNLAELYRRKVEDLHSCLNSPDTRTEAAEVLRIWIFDLRKCSVQSLQQEWNGSQERIKSYADQRRFTPLKEAEVEFNLARRCCQIEVKGRECASWRICRRRRGGLSGGFSPEGMPPMNAIRERWLPRGKLSRWPKEPGESDSA